MSERVTAACPACSQDEAIEIRIVGPWHSPDPSITDVACGCLLDPSQREALEREAIEAVTEGSGAW